MERAQPPWIDRIAIPIGSEVSKKQYMDPVSGGIFP